MAVAPLLPLFLCGSTPVSFPTVGPSSGYVLTGTSGTATAWINLNLGSAANVNVSYFCQAANNLSDVSSATTALSNLGGAPLSAPAFTGNPTAITQLSSDSSTRLATTAFVKNQSYITGITSSNVTTALGFTPVSTAVLGANSGVATLDSTGKLTTSQIPASLVGAVVYQGVWNSNTNTPTLASGTGTKGFYYKVSVAGTTTIDTISSWNVGDVIIFNGTTWDKIDGVPSEVLSVAGRTGTVVLSSSDISGLATSATTDTTNASNISSGTLANARLNTGTSGAVIGLLNGNLTFAGNDTFSALLTATSGIQFVSSGAVLQEGSAANIIMQANSTTSQEFQVYGTYTDATHFERFVVRSAAGNYTIGTEKGSGSGSARGIVIETGGTTALTIDTSQIATFASAVLAGAQVTSGSFVQAGNGNSLRIQNQFSLTSTGSDGSVYLSNYGLTGFTLLQLGPTIAAPSNVTLSAGSVLAGTSNTAGGNLTIAGSQGTGTGTGGSILFKVAPAGLTGTSQNALATALTIDSTKLATFTAGLVCTTIAPSSTATLVSGTIDAMTIGATTPCQAQVYSPINAQSGTTYTFALSDSGKTVSGSNTGATTFTLPLHASVAFPVNAEIVVMQLGAGKITPAITATGTLNMASGVTGSGGQYTAFVLKQTSTDVWVAFGNMA